MPVLQKFFAWSGTHVGGGSGGSAFLSAAGAVSMSTGARGAVERARQLEMTGPGRSAPPPQGAASTSGAATAAGPMAGGVGAAAAVGSQAVRGAGRAMTGEGDGSREQCGSREQ